jgi:amino acid transporter
VWLGVGVLAVTMIWGVVTLALGHGPPVEPLTLVPPPVFLTGWPIVDGALGYVFGLALTWAVVGDGETLARTAHEFPPPRVHALRRTALLTLFFAFSVTTLSTFLVTWLVPASEQALWANAPLAGLAQHLAGPAWIRDFGALALAGAAVCVVLPTAYAALNDAERMLHRASADGALPRGLASLHTRFGTPARAVDLAATALIAIILASAGRVTWLARG